MLGVDNTSEVLLPLFTCIARKSEYDDRAPFTRHTVG